jgi:hypothetical protein
VEYKGLTLPAGTFLAVAPVGTIVPAGDFIRLVGGDGLRTVYDFGDGYLWRCGTLPGRNRSGYGDDIYRKEQRSTAK